jgi:hypothetical protein
VKRQSGCGANCHRWGPPPPPDFFMSHTQFDDEYPIRNRHGEILRSWETGSIDSLTSHNRRAESHVQGTSSYREPNSETDRGQPTATFRVSLPAGPSLPGTYHLQHDTLHQAITARPIYEASNVTGITPFEASYNGHLQSGVFGESSS